MGIKCNSCDAVLSAGDAFCQKCGAPVMAVQEDGQAELNETPTPVTIYVEAPIAFASGLPAWNIEPPAVVVRRRARR